jgi:hypothetical protein
VLVDAFVADRHTARADDLLWAQAFGQTGSHDGPGLLDDVRLRARSIASLLADAVRAARLVTGISCIAAQLTADRARRAFQVVTDRRRGETAAVQALNLVAFVLAQVRVVHVQFHLVVKLCRLPRLRLFTSSGDALQN